jgi:hypothetical protein
MIFPDYQKMKDDRIRRECYGYAKGGSAFPVVLFINPISLFFRWLRGWIHLASAVTAVEVVDTPTRWRR